ncbi:NAD(P)-dependent oxidoreductase [candidate division KSB3 bacterium]|uniref:NAD(P)-dependent oxidoreductase n=1 Tax=candidate division KSB3 bacterium TaxID=2044937 RepID=A0A2G6E431_9BACT|nr:MAG: NAD(P)-dependent oxidoreductase [candidate division KSB3 bacterium]PIE29071.1 MAG: NAD(P)-dependent oxidoreductase [candidate division KSB3 bacterium]
MPACSQILISGGSGFLGWNLARYAAEDHNVFLTYHQHQVNVEGCKAPYYCDLRNEQATEKLIKDLHPDVIIHTAALANADDCEARQSAAYAINVDGTLNLVRQAEKIGARFVYISTDMVFDGANGNYREEHRPTPLNYYGETKLLGEKLVREISSNYLILRTALMYGHGNEFNGCFSDWLYNGLHRQQSISLFTDQYRTPLYVQDTVKAVFEMIDQPIKNDLFHLGGAERLSRYEFGKIFCEIWGLNDHKLHPVQMEEVDTLARRGYDCSLISAKIQHILSFQLSDVRTGLQQMKNCYVRRT